MYFYSLNMQIMKTDNNKINLLKRFVFFLIIRNEIPNTNIHYEYVDRIKICRRFCVFSYK